MEDLRVQLSIDATKIIEGANKAAQGFDSTASSVDKLFVATEKVDQALNSAGKSVQQSGQKVQVTQKQYDNLTKKLAEQKAKLDELIQAENRLQAEYDEKVRVINKIMQKNPQYNRSLMETTEGVGELREALQANADEQTRMASGMDVLAETLSGVEVAQKAVGKSAEDAAEKQNAFSLGSKEGTRTLSAMGLAAASASARLSGQDGLADALGAAGSSLSAFLLAGTNPAGLAIAGVTAGLNLLNAAFQGIKGAAERARQQVESLKASANGMMSIRSEIAEAEKYLKVLMKQNAAAIKGKGAKEQLLILFPQLTAGWNAEGEAILANNKAIEDQIKILKERAQTADLETLVAGRGALAGAIERRKNEQKKLIALEEELAKARKELADATLLFVDDYDPLKLGLEQQIAGLEDAIGDFVISSRTAAADVSEGMRGVLLAALSGMENLSEAQMIAAKTHVLDNMEELSKTFEETLLESGWNAAIQEYRTTIEGITNNADLVAEAQKKLAASNAATAQSFADLQQSAAATTDDLRNVMAEMDRLATVRGAIMTVENFAKAAKSGKQDTEKYSAAVSYLAKQYGISEKAVADNLPMLKNDLALKQSITNAEYAQAAAAAFASKAQIISMQAAGSVTSEQAIVIINALDDVIAKYAEWQRTAGPDGVSFNFDVGGGGRSSSGGGSSRKKAWEEELTLMERAKTETEELSYIYTATLERMLSDHRLSAKERERAERELSYAHQATAGELQQTYIDYLESILQKQKLNADERLRVEQKLVAAQKDLRRQQIEDLDALGNAVVDALRARYEAEQAAQTESITAQTKNAQDAAKAQTDAINKARDDETKRLQQDRDDKIKLIEEIRDAGVKAAEDERDAVVSGIESQIKAIDDYIKARDRSEKDGKDEKKLARLRQELAFEKDTYNQVKLQEQMLQMEKDISRRKEDERLADEKAALQEQLKTVKDSASDEIKAIKDKAAEQLQIAKDTAAQAIEQAKESAAQQLEIVQAQLDAEIANLQRRQAENDAYWQKRLANETLQGEALVLLNEGTQEEILALLKEYNPEYLKAGNEMGQMLYSGFDSKYKDLLARTDQVSRDIISKANSAISAWQRMQAMVGGGGGGNGSGGTYSSPAASLQTFAQQLINLPDTIDNALTGALYRMTEAPRNYYETRAREAGLDNYAIADFANGNLNAVTTAGMARRAQTTYATPKDEANAFISTLGKRKDVNLTVIFQKPIDTPYQHAKEIERISRKLIE